MLIKLANTLSVLLDVALRLFFVEGQIRLLCTPLALESLRSSRSFTNGLFLMDSAYFYAFRVFNSRAFDIVY